MKILNLYACLGGNRYKWGDEHDITAVEMDPVLAKLYQDRFPNDKVVQGDAHQYLLDHYKEYDFIWSSPPCPTHSRVRFSQKTTDFYVPKYPDMSLYQQVIFLENHFEGKYCVENVIPYYEPLIPAKKRGRHLYWTNFNLPNKLSDRKVNVAHGRDEVKNLCEFHEFDFYQYSGKQSKQKIARNLVDFVAGKAILDAAMGVMKKDIANQIDMFE